MNDFNLTVFSINFLNIYAAAVPGIYLAIRLSLKYGYYPPIQSKRSLIRKTVIKCWEDNYKTLSHVLDHVDLEHLRVLGKKNDVENKRFRNATLAFYLVSFLLLLESCFWSSVKDSARDYYAKYAFVVMILTLLTQVVSLSWLSFANYYQFNYFKTLAYLDETHCCNVNDESR